MPPVINLTYQEQAFVWTNYKRLSVKAMARHLGCQLCEVEKCFLTRGYDPPVNGELKRRSKAKPRRVEAFGEAKTVSEWAKDKRCKVTHGTLYARLVRGMNPETAMTAPDQRKR